MAQDIRNYFPSLSNKSNKPAKEEHKKKVKRIIDSDDEDVTVIEATPERSKTKPTNSKKKSTTISLSSDSDSDKKKEKAKLIPVNIDDIFTDKPVKQTLVTKPKIETIHNEEKPKVSKKKKRKTEGGIHKDEAFEKTLMELDDDILIENMDVLDRTIDEALNTNKKEDIEVKQGSSKENGSNKTKFDKTEAKNKELKPKRQRSPSISSTPKKIKLEHTDSGIDHDQEVYEKKRYSAMLYQKYKTRGGPKMHGQKEIPKGKPDCLKNLTFLRTGVLDSLESEEFENVVAEHGGRVVKSVSKKVNYLVVGEDAGPAKLAKAKDLGIPEVNEDELFDLILVKSGQKPKYMPKSDVSIESGIFLDDLPDEKQTKKDTRERVHDIKEHKKHSPIKEKQEKNRDKPNFKPLITNEKSLHNKEEMDKKLTKPDIKQANEEERQNIKKDLKKAHIEEVKLKPKQEKPLKSEQNEQEERSAKISLNKDHEKEKSKQETKIPETVDSTWTEKYKPIDTKGIIGQQGNPSNLNKLKNWLYSWYENQKPSNRKKISKPSPWAKDDNGAYFKAALLSGPPGVGKTTTATLVCKELKFDIVEFNASDTRSKKLLQEEVSHLLKTDTIAGFATGQNKTTSQRVLLMDEVDGMAGNEDRGGMQELINLIKTTKIPIICMCNDRNHQKMRSLSNYCFDLRFNPPKVEQIRGAMMRICFKEQITIDPKVLSEIIVGTGCDIRQTLNNLTMYAALNKNNSLDEMQNKSKNSKKDTVLGPWEVIRQVFTESEQKKMNLSDKSKLFFYDYSLGPLFVQENYLCVTPECPKKDTLKQVALAADAISRGDLIDAKIRSSNNWSLLESQAMYASVLPGFYMSGKITSRINFPSWLGQNSSRNKRKRQLSELYAHARSSISGSALSLKLDYLVHLRDAILNPMKKEGSAGISSSILTMQSYNLIRDDLTNLVELCQKKGATNPFVNLDPKIKAAFTRACNKVAFDTVHSKKKAAHTDDVLLEDEELIESNDEEKDDINTDSRIKVKSSTKTKATTSKKGGSSKGKGKEKIKK